MARSNTSECCPAQLTDELAESNFPGCGGAEGLRRELLKVEAADRAGRQAKRVQVTKHRAFADAFRQASVRQHPTAVQAKGPG